MEDFTPSRDYHSMWRNAMKIKNLDSLDLIFHSLCSEIGLTDPETQASGESAGIQAAQSKNRKDSHEGAKKL